MEKSNQKMLNAIDKIAEDMGFGVKNEYRIVPIDVKPKD